MSTNIAGPSGVVRSVRRRWLVGASVLAALLAGTAGGYRLARAMGVPATKPLYYSGTVEEAGTLVDGTRDFTLYVWSDATNTNGMYLKCTTIATGVTVTRGRFRIALDDTCTQPFHDVADLWIEPLVANVSLGRRKISAVPYALEADRAAKVGGRTIARITQCTYTGAPAGCPGCNHQWAGTDCDNGLPVGSCLGMGSSVDQCGGSITWHVLLPGESGAGANGGMSWYASGGNAAPCAGLTARAVYMCDR
jgi:hypothetical protein